MFMCVCVCVCVQYLLEEIVGHGVLLVPLFVGLLEGKCECV